MRTPSVYLPSYIVNKVKIEKYIRSVLSAYRNSFVNKEKYCKNQKNENSFQNKKEFNKKVKRKK
jgi:hypothetical protein